MNQQQSPAITQVVRIGLPVAVLIYYVSAALGFEYTPDSTYFSLQCARDLATGAGLQVPQGWVGAGYPNPLWTLLIAAGHVFGLDYLLTAKILSLILGSTAIMLSYFVAHEILRDHMLAFLAVLVIGLQSWFLQVAPSGNGLPLVLCLTLASLLFLLRNEYLLSAICAGMATLVAWELFGLMALLWFDITINTKDRIQGTRIARGCLLAFVATLLPWILGALYASKPFLPELLPAGDGGTAALLGKTGFLLLVGFAVAGIVLLARSGAAGRERMRNHYSLWFWMLIMGLASLQGPEILPYLVLPLLVIYAFYGLQQIGERFVREELRYTLLIAVAGVFLLVNQLTYTLEAKPRMAVRVEREQHLTAIASWLHQYLPEGASVSARETGLLGYLSGREILPEHRVLPNQSDFVVAVEQPSDEYVITFAPEEQPALQPGNVDARIVVWRKNTVQ